jgi:hypothetical protein
VFPRKRLTARTGAAHGRPRATPDPKEYAEHLCQIYTIGTAADCAQIMETMSQRSGIGSLTGSQPGLRPP